jgi:hypothetical protein
MLVQEFRHGPAAFAFGDWQRRVIAVILSIDVGPVLHQEFRRLRSARQRSLMQWPVAVITLGIDISFGASKERREGGTPSHQFFYQSYWRFPTISLNRDYGAWSEPQN